MTTEFPVKAELCMRMKTALEAALITDVAEDDNSRITRVTVGKWADDPQFITLSIYPDHPLAPEDRGDTTVAIPNARWGAVERAYIMPAETFGGSNFDTIEGTVQIRMIKKVAPETAVKILEKVKARIKHTIRNTANLRRFEDAWGNYLWALDPAAAWGYASGGDSTSVIVHWCDWVARTSVRRAY